MRFLRRHLGLHVLRVLVMPLEGLPPVKVQHPSLRYVPLPESEALEWCAYPEMEMAREQVTAAYARGDLIVGVTEHGEPVGCVWFAFGAAPHTDGVWVQVAADTRYSYRAFIRASHRGRRIAQELYTCASEICPRRGRRKGLIVIYADNAVSLRASVSAGRVPVGYAGYLVWRGWLVPFRSPGARQHGMRMALPGARCAIRTATNRGRAATGGTQEG